MKTLDELVNVTESGWPLVTEWFSGAAIPVEVLPASVRAANQVLLEAQVTTRSPMGAVIYNSGGILIDDGWLRILGSGHERLLRSLSAWNAMTKLREQQRLPGACLVADDIVGGFFALNGGAFEAQIGHVHYFAPDTLKWEDLKLTYSQFLVWAVSDQIAMFYKSFRWDGWREEIRQTNGDKSFSIYPFLWAAGPSLSKRSRRLIPVEEVWGLQIETRAQLTQP